MTGFAWLALLLGLVVLGGCLLLPREINREDDPLSNVRLPKPDLQGLVLSIQQRNARPRPYAVPRRPARSTPVSAVPEGPSAMGAPQPVISQETGGGLTLPGA